MIVVSLRIDAPRQLSAGDPGLDKGWSEYPAHFLSFVGLLVSVHERHIALSPGSEQMGSGNGIGT